MGAFAQQPKLSFSHCGGELPIPRVVRNSREKSNFKELGQKSRGSIFAPAPLGYNS